MVQRVNPSAAVGEEVPVMLFRRDDNAMVEMRLRQWALHHGVSEDDIVYKRPFGGPEAYFREGAQIDPVMLEEQQQKFAKERLAYRDPR